MSLRWPYKDPNEVKDYELDWYGTAAVPGPMLAETDSIVSSTWIVPTGITKVTDTYNTQKTVIWLSGGTASETYVLTNRIVTLGGRTWDQSVKIKIKDK